jgi:hypothetical protein
LRRHALEIQNRSHSAGPACETFQAL